MIFAQEKDGRWVCFTTANQTIWKAYLREGSCGSSYSEKDDTNDLWVNTDEPGYEYDKYYLDEDIDIPQEFESEEEFVKDITSRYGWKMVYWMHDLKVFLVKGEYAEEVTNVLNKEIVNQLKELARIVNEKELYLVKNERSDASYQFNIFIGYPMKSNNIGKITWEDNVVTI